MFKYINILIKKIVNKVIFFFKETLILFFRKFVYIIINIRFSYLLNYVWFNLVFFFLTNIARFIYFKRRKLSRIYSVYEYRWIHAANFVNFLENTIKVIFKFLIFVVSFWKEFLSFLLVFGLIDFIHYYWPFVVFRPFPKLVLEMEPYSFDMYKENLRSIHDVIIYIAESILAPIQYKYNKLQEDFVYFCAYYIPGEYFVKVFFFFCKYFSFIMPILGSMWDIFFGFLLFLLGLIKGIFYLDLSIIQEYWLNFKNISYCCYSYCIDFYGYKYYRLVEKITWSNFCLYLTSIEFKVLALNDNLFSKIVVFFQSLYSFFFIKLPEFFNYIISNKMAVSSLAIIIIFIFFMYIRSSLPRYKLIDFVELYWKHILVYVIILIIIYIFGGGSDSGLDIN